MNVVSSLLLLVSFVLAPAVAGAAFANNHSVLLGERAAGMGGAFTALAADPSASPFYNPATTILQEGSSFSGTVSVYDKYDTKIGATDDVGGAAARISRGFFRAIPSSTGTILNYKTFAVGISILHPDYDFFYGEIQNNTGARSQLDAIDQSMWAGFTFAARLTPVDSVGASLYYTARSYERSVNDHISVASVSTITTEAKNLTTNNLVAILGYHRQLDKGWKVGVSYRPPSVQISGEGTYDKVTTVSQPYSITEIYHGSTKAITVIPQKFAIGLAQEVVDSYTFSMDVSLYGAVSYQDFPDAPDSADDLHYRQVADWAIGYEQFMTPWLSVRAGLFTNLSAAESPSATSNYRQLDQLNMYGGSINGCIRLHEQTSFTFGGYYEGGSGLSTQYVSNSVKVLQKTQNVFTMLVGTGFHF